MTAAMPAAVSPLSSVPTRIAKTSSYWPSQIVCAETPEPFQAVGRWYDDFSQTTDEEVHDLLERARGGSHVTA
jgi:predicted phosphoribosyltransferase